MESLQLVLFANKKKLPPYVASCIVQRSLKLISFPFFCSLWREPLVLPAYFAAFSSFAIIISIIWRSTRKIRSRIWPSSRSEDTDAAKVNSQLPTAADVYEHDGFFSEIKATIKAHGIAVFLFRCLKLASCIALVALTVVAFIRKEESEDTEKSSIDMLKKGTKGGKKRRRRAQALHHAEWIEMIQCATYVSRVQVTC